MVDSRASRQLLSPGATWNSGTREPAEPRSRKVGTRLSRPRWQLHGPQPGPVRRRHPCPVVYFRSPERLSVAASAVFQLAETGNATVVVPAVVAAEFYSLSAKLGSPMEPSALLEALDSVSGIELSELGRAQLERLDRFSGYRRCTTGSSLRKLTHWALPW